MTRIEDNFLKRMWSNMVNEIDEALEEREEPKTTPYTPETPATHSASEIKLEYKTSLAGGKELICGEIITIKGHKGKLLAFGRNRIKLDISKQYSYKTITLDVEIKKEVFLKADGKHVDKNSIIKITLKENKKVEDADTELFVEQKEYIGRFEGIAGGERIQIDISSECECKRIYVRIDDIKTLSVLKEVST